MEVILGVTLGGAVVGGVLYAAKNNSAEEKTIIPPKQGGRCFLERDKALLCLLHEPLELFCRIDPEATEELLDSLDDLVRLFEDARNSKSPAIVVCALAARRKGKRALDRLSAGARSSFPARASDVTEDTEALLKVIADYLHNIQQASALSMLESI